MPKRPLNAAFYDDSVLRKRGRLKVTAAASRNKRLTPSQRLSVRPKVREELYDGESSEETGSESDHESIRSGSCADTGIPSIPPVQRIGSHRKGSIYRISSYDENRCLKFVLGPRNAMCDSCGAMNFEADRVARTQDFVICCRRGKVPNELFSFKYPENWKVLLAEVEHPLFHHIRRYIRHYNSSLSFTSMSAKLVNDINRGNVPYIFKVHGSTMHFSYNKSPSNLSGETPKFSQCYFFDPEDAVQFRRADDRSKILKPELLKFFDAELRRVNPFFKSLRNMLEIECELLATNNTEALKHLSLEFYKEPKTDLRRWNAPTAQEIGAVYTSSSEKNSKRDFAIYPKNVSAVTRVSSLSNYVEPMTYALLYPYGGLGWGPRLQGVDTTGRNKYVSQREYYVSKLMHRENVFNPILHSGKLYQQYIVDMKLMLDEQKLQYIRTNQEKLLVEQYKGLLDALENQAETMGVNMGRRIICPSSVIGSDRWYREQFCDAMALVTRFGRPDLFVTFTCNPDWPEIKENLYPGQTFHDRPELVAISFLHRSKSFMRDIVKKSCLGAVKAWCYTVEFQKRGMPHIHLLLIMEENSKISTPDHVDDVITAELPDPHTEPELFELVRKCMIHGPCNVNPKERICIQENGTCAKNYPHDFQNNTTFGRRGWPLYRRRRGTSAIIKCGKQDVQVNNRWVVPYNKYLSQKYQCHINVEACVSVQSVKYVYKYIYKGGDRATVIVKGKNLLIYDEVQAMLDGKYLTATQAAWELFMGKTQAKSHAVKRLGVHLPDQQNVVFTSTTARKAIERASMIESMLQAFFTLCSSNGFARTLLYEEVPQHFIFIKSSGIWRLSKKKKKCVTRIYAVNPKDSEKFYLRLLLLHVRGPTSFENLRTINGVVYPTYREASVALGLVESDNEWELCLREAVDYAMSPELRRLFANILAYNEPVNAPQLFNKFKNHLTEDFREMYSENDSEQMALQEIERHLRENRCSLSNFGMQPPDGSFEPTSLEETMMINEASRLEQSLNAEQAEAFTAITDSVLNPGFRHKCFFIDGPGGSGKTWTYRAIQAHMLAKKKKVLALATTGIAADLLHGGRTMHSGFKMPYDVDGDTTVTILRGTWQYESLRSSDLIIIDEASSMKSGQLDYISEVLKYVNDCEEDFGGRTVVLGGDFRQTLPVIKGGSPAAVLDCVVKRSTLWERFKILKLKTNLRALGHDDFCKWLLRIGDGCVPSPVPEFEGYVKIPELNLCPPHMDILEVVYGDSIRKVDRKMLAESIVVTPKNKDVHEYNRRALRYLDGREMCYYSVNTVEGVEDCNVYPPEFLNAQDPPGYPVHELKLKVGAIIMLLRNLQINAGLLNGTRLVVLGMHPHVIYAEILKGSKAGTKVFIPRIICQSPDPTLPYVLKRRQFPVSLSYVMTVNKSQGQSFDRVGVYLPNTVFSHGQLYVALSRTRNPANLFVQICHDTPDHVDMKFTTANVVWRQVLSE